MAHLKLTTFTTRITAALIGGALLTAPAFADPDKDMADHTPQMDPAVTVMPGKADYFAAADLDSDSLLSASEFELFIDTLVSTGDSDAEVISASGDYLSAHAHFDKNGDEGVSYEEVTSSDPYAIQSETPAETLWEPETTIDPEPQPNPQVE